MTGRPSRALNSEPLLGYTLIVYTLGGLLDGPNPRSLFWASVDTSVSVLLVGLWMRAVWRARPHSKRPVSDPVHVRLLMGGVCVTSEILWKLGDAANWTGRRFERAYDKLYDAENWVSSRACEWVERRTP